MSAATTGAADEQTRPHDDIFTTTAKLELAIAALTKISTTYAWGDSPRFIAGECLKSIRSAD